MPWTRYYSKDENHLYLANKLYDAMHAENLSQREFGRQLGLSQQMVSCWLTGREMPSPERLKQLCDRFEWDYKSVINHILSEVGNENTRERIAGRYFGLY